MPIRRTIHLTLGGAFAAVLLASTPALAAPTLHGATESQSNGSQSYELSYAGAAEDNDVDVTDAGDFVLFHDDFPITASGTCHPGTPSEPARANTAWCPEVVSTTPASLSIEVHDGNNAVAVDGGYPTEITATGDGLNELVGGSGFDLITGGDGPDELSGNGGTDALIGGGGTDLLSGGSGGDILRGGTGRDVVTYLARTATIRVTPGVGLGNDGQANEGDTVFPDVEVAVGGSGNDEMTAPPSGEYEFRGSGGEDMLYGNPSAGKLLGGPGDDYLEGGGGADELQGGSDADILVGGAGPDALRGGTGEDLVAYTTSQVPVIVDLDGSGGDDGAVGEGDDVGSDVERITGGQDDDVLTGDGAPNRIIGGPGDDTIEGKGGADDLRGGAGEDTLLSADGVLDAVDCGAGADDFEPDALDAPIGCENDLRPPPAAPAPAPTDDPDPSTGNEPSPAPGTDPVNNPTPSPGQTGPATPAPSAAAPVVPAASGALKIGPGRIRLSRSGIAKLTVTCPKSSLVGCKGTLKLRLAAKTVGTRRFTAAAGRRTTVRITVANAARVRGLRLQAVATSSGATVTRKVRVLK